MLKECFSTKLRELLQGTNKSYVYQEHKANINPIRDLSSIFTDFLNFGFSSAYRSIFKN